jgi:hypothetical protein
MDKKIIIKNYILYLSEISEFLSIDNKKKVADKINTINNSDWTVEKLGKHDTLVPIRLQLFLLYQEMEVMFTIENINEKIIWLKDYEIQYIRKLKINDILSE